MSVDTAPPMVRRVLRATFGHDVAQRIETALSRYVEASGEVPLDDLLGLPKVPGQRRRHLRNAWLREAMNQLRLTDANATPGTLHAALARFHSRGPWRFWCERSDAPPAEAAALHVALFHVLRANDGRGLSRSHIAALLKNSPGFKQRRALEFAQDERTSR